MQCSISPILEDILEDIVFYNISKIYQKTLIGSKDIRCKLSCISQKILNIQFILGQTAYKSVRHDAAVVWVWDIREL